MKIAVLGAGSVGQTMGAALAARGHDVTLGIRNPSGEELSRPRSQAEALTVWQARTKAAVATLSDAAAGAGLIINATQGAGSLEALTAAGAKNLAGKVLIDIANPLDFSRGMPPFLIAGLSGPTSLGEEIQRAFPAARVVKAFNTIAAAVMVDPSLIPGAHDLFIAGNDPDAKAAVSDLARAFGWTNIVDLGGIDGARASESLLPIWVRLYMTGGSPLVNLHVARA
ncbi:MAG: NAD(P)-binding domain-containing protein [Rhodobacter sp.]|nr:NAD(P)-binding domain-containing protein [Rhodobacter sp.]MCA3513356.1 NAD(P)-binding domain-containing protein [Rhodobacter sp.]MCA3521157.1 NAD(P)-binding domain-containing protein [Rhodobacter sp.]MCA3521768.1 NAD(P)-binding domain-containing protein [Rhodobacter sp.]MCA3525130.1 NAD(P)-binding domain-containing protein [Rhodobacter sp.]